LKKLKKLQFLMGIGDWGLGIGDWGLGQSPIPNPQSPIPNHYSYIFLRNINFTLVLYQNFF
jgi:hypothetical protein